ncbi:MAG TPA: tetratricopeptide repeat-containing sensor histidine kinase [Mucilaginibacter sp.]
MIMCPRWLLLVLFLLPSMVFAQNAGILLKRLNNARGKEKTDLYLELSRSYAENQPDSAVHWINAGLQEAENRNDEAAQGALLLELGKINAMHHHPDLARKFCNEALNIFRNLHDTEGMARAYDTIGFLDTANEGPVSAWDDLNQAMKYYRDSHDSSGVLETYAGLGRVFEEKGETVKALNYYLRALALYERRRQKNEDYFVLLENIGNLYLKKGDHQSALHYLQEGVRDSGSIGRRDTEVDLIDEEGKVYQKEGMQNRALMLYKKALTEAKRYNQPEEQAKALINIAGILKKQNTRGSLKDLQSALLIAKQLHEPKLEESIYEALADVYRQENNYREAMDALQDQHHLLDSLLRADTVKDIAALDSSYALERSLERIGHLQATDKLVKKELNIGIIILVAIALILLFIWLYLKKIKQLNRQLAASNRVKDTLFSVIGHDLKGPASSAVQLFELMETEHFTEQEIRSMISDLHKQMAASLELLQALFEWGRAQLQGVSAKAVELNPVDAVTRCFDLLSWQAAQKGIRLNSLVSDNLRILVDADHFELIIRNLMANAIKFSHENGAVAVSAVLSADHTEAIFAIQDNGVGINKKQQELFQTSIMKVNFGTRREKGSGLGLMLVKDFVKANKGRIWLNSNEGEGATFFVALPVAA